MDLETALDMAFFDLKYSLISEARSAIKHLNQNHGIRSDFATDNYIHNLFLPTSEQDLTIAANFEPLDPENCDIGKLARYHRLLMHAKLENSEEPVSSLNQFAADIEQELYGLTDFESFKAGLGRMYRNVRDKIGRKLRPFQDKVLRPAGNIAATLAITAFISTITYYHLMQRGIVPYVELGKHEQINHTESLPTQTENLQVELNGHLVPYYCIDGKSFASVSLKKGETLSHLSVRYDVPVDCFMYN
jgi:hypothetical protein